MEVAVHGRLLLYEHLTSQLSCNIILATNNMQERFKQILDVAHKHPKTTVSLLSLLAGGTAILAMRLLHHKLVTFPGMSHLN